MRMKLAAMALSSLLPTVLLPTAALAETITLVCGNKQDAYLTVDFDNRTARYQSAGLFNYDFRDIEITNDAVYFGNYTLDLNNSILSNSTNDWGPISCRRGGRVR